jgi:hypothetical protein
MRMVGYAGIVASLCLEEREMYLHQEYCTPKGNKAVCLFGIESMRIVNRAASQTSLRTQFAPSQSFEMNHFVSM